MNSGACSCIPSAGILSKILQVREVAKKTMKAQPFLSHGINFSILPSGKIENESGDTVKEVDKTGKIIDLV